MQKYDMIIPQDTEYRYFEDNKDKLQSLKLTADEIINGSISNIQMFYDLVKNRERTGPAYEYICRSVDQLIDYFDTDDKIYTEIMDSIEDFVGPFKHPASVQLMGMLCAGNINRRYWTPTGGKFVINPFDMGVAGALHDIGKIYIDPRILDSPDELNPYDKIDIMGHPMIAYDMLERIADESIRNIIVYHHFLNGKGYPKDLNPQNAGYHEHLLGIIDIYDALRSGEECGRYYKKAMGMPEALTEMTLMLEKGEIEPWCFDEFLYFLRDNSTEGRELLSGPLRLNS